MLNSEFLIGEQHYESILSKAEKKHLKLSHF